MEEKSNLYESNMDGITGDNSVNINAMDVGAYVQFKYKLVNGKSDAIFSVIFDNSGPTYNRYDC